MSSEQIEWEKDDFLGSDIIYLEALSRKIIILNSYDVAIELLDKKSHIYSSRWILFYDFFLIFTCYQTTDNIFVRAVCSLPPKSLPLILKMGFIRTGWTCGGPSRLCRTVENGKCDDELLCSIFLRQMSTFISPRKLTSFARAFFLNFWNRLTDSWITLDS